MLTVSNAFELWCWRRLLRIPWTARTSNQSILKGINPEYSLEGLMLKLQYFGHLMRRSNSGKDWEQEENEMIEDEMVGWHHWLNGHKFEQSLGDSEGQGSLVCCSPWGHKELDMTECLNATILHKGFCFLYLWVLRTWTWWGGILFIAIGLPQQFLSFCGNNCVLYSDTLVLSSGFILDSISPKWDLSLNS